MNKNHQSNYAKYPPASKELIESKKNRNEPVYLPLLYTALLQEAKFKKNFANAEWLFDNIMLDYDSRENESDRYYTEGDERLFAKAIATMVRYAITPAKAMQYATLFFKKYNDRIRTPSREMIILTNLIFAHTIKRNQQNQQNQQNMEMALNILKLALRIGVYKLDSSCYQDTGDDNLYFSDPVDVFTTVSKRVLEYFELKLSTDKTELVPLGQQYSHSSQSDL